MRALWLLLSCLWLASCASGPGGRSTRDRLGHGPGPQGFRTVVLDAGHGGHDSGAISRTTRAQEKHLALDLAQRVRRELGGGFRVLLTREGDGFLPLDQRVATANRYSDAVLLSLHFNHGPSRLAGPETFYWRVDSYGLATRVQRALAAAIPGESGNRGLVRRRLRLTRNPEIPAVLVEAGYLSNPAEARRLQSAGYRQQLAAAIAGAIKMQAARGDAGLGPLPRPLNEAPSRGTDARQ